MSAQVPFADSDLLSFLQDNLQEGEKMRGTIRPSARHTVCGECGEPFRLIHARIGYRCKCKRSPAKFVIDISWSGKRPRIYCDKSGQVLDSWERSRNMLTVINSEIAAHKFDPDSYIKAEISRYYVSTLLDKYKAEKEPELAESGRAGFKRNCNHAKAFFSGARDVRDIRKVDIKAYYNDLKAKYSHLAPKTFKNILDDFKAFLNWCISEEISVIVPEFPAIEVPEPVHHWLSFEDQAAALDLVPVADRPIFSFIMFYGCRPSEARALKVKDVNLHNMTVTISATFSGKTLKPTRKGRKSKPVVQPIHPDMKDYIVSRVKNNLPEAFLFPNPRTGTYYKKGTLQDIWESVRTSMKLPKGCRLYDASRHSVGSQLAASGANAITIKQMLGHSSVKMTERYVHPELENMRVFMERRSLKTLAPVSKIKEA